MPVRDLLLFAAFAVLAPMIVMHPYIGVLAWVVFGLLNPHRLSFGPAYDFPFALVIAILTLVGIVLSRDHRQIKGGAPGVVLLVLMAWMSVTTVFALTPEAAQDMWSRVMKVFVMTFMLMFLLHTKRHVELLLGAIVVSIGFYGVKGGLFTIVTGGNNLVLGPNETLLESNNHLAVAVVMTIPLILHFYQQTSKRWIRLGLLASILFCAAAVLGSYSRGAVLALAAMGLVLWLRSSHKSATFVLALVTALVLIPFMPERWDSRMHTIETYEDDGSAMSRIYAWRAAWNIATDRVLGGGFEYPSPEVIAKYSPGTDISVAHSIYLQALGEHGFIGLSLFVLFWALVWVQCARTRRLARDRPDLRWAFSLMSMTQASFVGFAVGGAFINIAFWDMPYYLYALVVVTNHVIQERLRSEGSVDAADSIRGTRLAMTDNLPIRPVSSA